MEWDDGDGGSPAVVIKEHPRPPPPSKVYSTASPIKGESLSLCGIVLTRRSDGLLLVSRIIAGETSGIFSSMVRVGDALCEVAGVDVRGWSVSEVRNELLHSRSRWVKIGVQRQGIAGILFAELDSALVRDQLEPIAAFGHGQGQEEGVGVGVGVGGGGTASAHPSHDPFSAMPPRTEGANIRQLLAEGYTATDIGGTNAAVSFNPPPSVDHVGPNHNHSAPNGDDGGMSEGGGGVSKDDMKSNVLRRYKLRVQDLAGALSRSQNEVEECKRKMQVMTHSLSSHQHEGNE